MKCMRMDLSCFGDSFGVEKNPHSLFTPSPSVEGADTRNFLQAGAVHPGVLGEPPWHRTHSAGAGCKLGQPVVGRGRRAAGQACPDCLPPSSLRKCILWMCLEFDRKFAE